jgi:hypothetical protein
VKICGTHLKNPSLVCKISSLIPISPKTQEGHSIAGFDALADAEAPDYCSMWVRQCSFAVVFA